METRNKFFIEVDCCQQPEKGQPVSGDVYLQRRYQNRIFLVLASGAGSGIRSNITSQVVASMVLNYAIGDVDPVRAAESVVRTFAGTVEAYEESRIKFTAVDIHENGRVKLLEFGNPPCMVFHRGQEIALPQQTYDIVTGDQRHQIVVSEFNAEFQDRLIFTGEGVLRSGVGTRRLPHGWQRQGIVTQIGDSICEQPDVSAYQLCRQLLGRAEINDLFTIKNDLSCFSVYFRQPRQILVCSGPPFNDKKDEILADMVARYPGEVLISGGTTAKIIARELGREIEVQLQRDASNLPPTSKMEGVDLITEGVLTLIKVKGLLERITGSDIPGRGTDARVARLLMEHDVIEFVVGTRINPIYQDPNLPVELELRRNLIKELARVLEVKFMKEVHIQYI